MSEHSRIAALKAAVAMRLHQDGLAEVLARARELDAWLAHESSNPGAPASPGGFAGQGPPEPKAKEGPVDAGKDQGETGA